MLRMTLDWTDYDLRLMRFGAKLSSEITEAMARAAKAKLVTGGRGGGRFGRTATRGGRLHYNASAYNTTHIQGGAIMGDSPERSVLNTWLQHWQMPNLWVVGSASFPQNSSANPTLTILAVTHRAADALIGRYLKKPGALA
ncbi:MAG TPA: GMC family oxidoreductase [Bryobacterales bacterium]|nr:GMC family oxidoreductase [Bryobacterales bacterium]